MCEVPDARERATRTVVVVGVREGACNVGHAAPTLWLSIERLISGAPWPREGVREFRSCRRAPVRTLTSTTPSVDQWPVHSDSPVLIACICVRSLGKAKNQREIQSWSSWSPNIQIIGNCKPLPPRASAIWFDFLDGFSMHRPLQSNLLPRVIRAWQSCS